MTLESSTLTQAMAGMAAVKSRFGPGCITNFFRQEMMGDRVLMADSECSVVFLSAEFDFYRLYFFTREVADLGRLLASTRLPGPTVSGYLSKVPVPGVNEAFAAAGFSAHARYRRMTSVRLPRRPASDVSYAEAHEVQGLHQELFAIFDRFTDHLPTKEKLATFVSQRQVIVNRRDGVISGAVIFQILDGRVNYNYLFNRSADPMDLLRLQTNFYGVMAERGIQSGFLWVNEANTQIVRLHASLGWKFDGLVDQFFLQRTTN
jgi:hypothetical protein